MKRFFRVRYLLVLIIALILASGVLGFAAGNTMPASTTAGDGNVTISGYTVANIAYTLNTTDPTKLDAVTFDVAGSGKPASVKAAVISGGAWYSCSSATTGAGPWSFTCATTSSPQTTVLAMNNLRVVAAQ